VTRRIFTAAMNMARTVKMRDLVWLIFRHRTVDYRAPHRRHPAPLPAPLTPEQLEKARAAMQEIHGDSGLLGRRL